MKATVITDVVDKDLCIGCGICAALCPQGILEMAWNQFGELNPIGANPCVLKCGLCLRVCPFSKHDENENTIGKTLYSKVSGISDRPEVGYYLTSYVGYSEKHRPSSASGGVATWILEKLLEDKIVDHVICVAPTSASDRLFSFAVIDTPEDLLAGAGSAYYPVEMSAVIKHVLEVPGRYAITGLPCFIKAIRLAQQKNIELQNRIVAMIGLVCGQLKSKHFTDYVAALVGIEGQIGAVRYRGKSQAHPASNYYYAFSANDGHEKRIFWDEGIGESWNNRWFTQNACNYCDDIFAECADVTCMDAWLPGYSMDSRGTSLVLVRSPLVRDMITRGKDIILDPISVDQVIQSQAGVVEVKRKHLAYRLYLDQKRGKDALNKRVPPEKPQTILLQKEITMKEKMQILSKDIWIASGGDAKRLREAMNPLMRKLKAYRLAAATTKFPSKTLHYAWEKVRSSIHG